MSGRQQSEIIPLHLPFRSVAVDSAVSKVGVIDSSMPLSQQQIIEQQILDLVVEDIIEELQADLEDLTIQQRREVLSRCRKHAEPLVKQRSHR